jgi:hypothetical protein
VYNGTHDVDVFVEKFQAVALLGNWSNLYQITVLPTYLEGTARAVYDKLTAIQKQNVDVILQTLRDQLAVNSSIYLKQYEDSNRM